ncbi:hypothetical protein CCH79_00002672, partial [Gambusia affinis]
MRTKRMYRTWIYTVVISVFEAWSQDAVKRDVTFNLGTNINLTCTNKTRADIVFIIWEMHLKNKNCKISFVNDDKGIDSCKDGKSLLKTSTAPPVLSAWLEQKGNKMVALCRAERGTPVANLSWSYGGSSEPAVKTQLDPDGFVTVESHLELLEDIGPEELTCIVQHRFWDQEKILVPKLREAAVLHITPSQPKRPALDLDNNQNGRKTDDADH